MKLPTDNIFDRGICAICFHIFFAIPDKPKYMKISAWLYDRASKYTNWYLTPPAQRREILDGLQYEIDRQKMKSKLKVVK